MRKRNQPLDDKERVEIELDQPVSSVYSRAAEIRNESEEDVRDEDEKGGEGEEVRRLETLTGHKLVVIVSHGVAGHEIR
jgi:hypothetical protein